MKLITNCENILQTIIEWIKTSTFTGYRKSPDVTTTIQKLVSSDDMIETDSCDHIYMIKRFAK